MTVGELREALEDLDEDLPVLVNDGLTFEDVSGVEEVSTSYLSGVVIS